MYTLEVIRNLHTKGKQEYVIVNKGTSPENIKDWKNNKEQLVGKSVDMDKSLWKANYFVTLNSNYEVTFIGHSKGGAEATINALITGNDAITFNTAKPNVEAYKHRLKNSDVDIWNYVVEGDVLNKFFGESTEGDTIYLSRQAKGDDILSNIENHLMSWVKKALREDGY